MAAHSMIKRTKYSWRAAVRAVTMTGRAKGPNVVILGEFERGW
jgi:hypothetical protein